MPPASAIRKADRDINAFVEVFENASCGVKQEGPLSGLTFAVKEIIEQEHRASPWGVDFLQDRIGTQTAPCVTRLEQAGARRLGTTRSTLMAIVGESLTKNPRDLERGPGGSSAGSAAAVAAGMVDFALGTQTVGSVIRPASYCGVVGFKPTFGRISTEAVMPLARELDHVGFLAADICVARAAFNALTGDRPATARITHLLVPEIWFRADIHPGMKNALDRAAQCFREHGIEISPFAIPREIAQHEATVLEGLLDKGIHDNHADFIRKNATRLPEELVAFEARGQKVTTQEHNSLCGRQRDMQMQLSDQLPQGSALLCPSVMDLPPLLGQGTGARQPQRLWTLLGWPALGIPTGTYGGAHDHLPVSVQLVGRSGEDTALLDLGTLLEASMKKSNNGLNRAALS